MFWVSKEKLPRRNFDTERIAEQGMFFYPSYKSSAPNHLSTFVDFMKEYLFYMEAEGVGLITLEDLFPYMWYFWDKDPICFTNREIERFIYSINQDPFMRMCIRIFVYDSHYLKEQFGDRKFPDGSSMKDHIGDILEFQKLFLIEADRVCRSNFFRNLVCTIFFYKDDRYDDPEFVDWVWTSNLQAIL